MSLLEGAAASNKVVKVVCAFSEEVIKMNNSISSNSCLARLHSSLTYLQGDVREVVKVGGVVDGADLHGDGGGPLPDVVPVHPLEPGHALDVLQTLDPLLPLVTEPARHRVKVDIIGCIL